jgi:AcrR family transcriptional regulator
MGADTREQILVAARELVLERGYDATSFAAIAERLGLSKTAVAYHFHPKETLLAALVLPGVQEIRALLAEPADRSAAGRRRFAVSYLDVLLRHRELIGVLVGDMTVLGHPQADQVRALRDRVLDRIAASGSAADLTQGWAVLGAVHIGVLRTLDQPVETVQPVLRRAVTAIIGR